MRALRLPSVREIAKTTTRGQYEGYTKEKDVQANSKTETYFKIETYLNTPKWEGVPIYLEGGKAMNEDRVEVRIVFRHREPCLCPPEGGRHYRNVLHYRIQPNEGIEIRFWVKKPGPKMILEEKSFRFTYKEAFEEDEIADAYEKLLLSAIQGDQTLFVSTQEIMASWKFIDRIWKTWQKDVVPLQIYQQHLFPTWQNT